MTQEKHCRRRSILVYKLLIGNMIHVTDFLHIITHAHQFLNFSAWMQPNDITPHACSDIVPIREEFREHVGVRALKRLVGRLVGDDHHIGPFLSMRFSVRHNVPLDEVLIVPKVSLEEVMIVPVCVQVFVIVVGFVLAVVFVLFVVVLVPVLGNVTE